MGRIRKTLEALAGAGIVLVAGALGATPRMGVAAPRSQVVPAAKTVYVNPAGDDAHTCLEPATALACKTIKGALGKATAGDTVEVAAGTYVENVSVTKQLTIRGAGEGTTIIDGNGKVTGASTVTIGTGVQAVIERLTIRNGSNPGVGGGVRNDGDLTLSRVTVRDSVAGNTGGGIGLFATGAALTLQNSTVISNTASSGGGIGSYADDHRITLTASAVVSNTAGDNGGISSEGTLTIVDSRVSYNRAMIRVAGLQSRGPFTMSGSVLSDNVSEQLVGGARLGSGTAALQRIVNSTISGNIAKVFQAGGLEVSQGGTLALVNTTVSGNRTGQFGGGIANSGGQLKLFNVTVTGNTADDGGGLYSYGGTGSSTEVYNSIIAANIFDEDKGDCGGVTITANRYNLIQTLTGNPKHLIASLRLA